MPQSYRSALHAARPQRSDEALVVLGIIGAPPPTSPLGWLGEARADNTSCRITPVDNPTYETVS